MRIDKDGARHELCPEHEKQDDALFMATIVRKYGPFAIRTDEYVREMAEADRHMVVRQSDDGETMHYAWRRDVNPENTHVDVFGRKIEAAPDRVLVLVDTLPSQTKAGIHLPDSESRQPRAARGRVVSVGRGVDWIALGDRLAWEHLTEHLVEEVAEDAPPDELLIVVHPDRVLALEAAGGRGFRADDGAWLVPAPGRFIARLGEPERATRGGIVLPEMTVARSRKHRGEVVAVGAGVSACAVGDVVQWVPGKDFGLQQGGQILGVVQATELLLVQRS